MAKGFDYSKIRYYKLYPIARAIAKIVVKLLFRVKYVGKENIPQSQGYILASNHISLLDPVVSAIAVKDRIFYMGKAELFDNKLVGYFMTHFQGFPVNRNRGDLSAIEYAINVVKENNVLGIFPEGTRSKDGKPLSPKAGIAMIANKTGADVLPVSVYCEGKVRPFKKITVRFGELIKNDELVIENGKASELKRATHIVMDKIVDMWEEGHCK
ncbi:MAG: 1-acyl-sn-glycerol-3-phosphate acyltransferase [Clostridia bacterium]|nr:1-acyl-sn-glycerol-3-phosphate acyltransferase [Clostridia bacterium]